MGSEYLVGLLVWLIFPSPASLGLKNPHGASQGLGCTGGISLPIFPGCTSLGV